MIYRNSYFIKELRQAYIENRISTLRKLVIGAFLGLVAIVLHLLLMTLTESVLTDVVPHIMRKDYFSTVYTFISVSFFLYIIYFLINYEYLTFTEIRKNRWYLLVKMGYNPQSMIFKKIAAMLFTLLFVYTTGFSFTILITVLLKYPFTYSCLPDMYLIGLLDLTVISIIGATISLYTTSAKNARFSLFFISMILYILRITTGYRNVIINSDILDEYGIVGAFDFSNSSYYLIICLVIIFCISVCFFRAKNVAKYYNLPFDESENKLPLGTKLVRFEERTKRFFLISKKNKQRQNVKIFDITIITFLAFIISSAVTLNVFYLINSSSELTVNEIIPYFVNSDTSLPEIEKNDLAFFKKTNENAEIQSGIIVLLKHNDKISVQKIIVTDGNLLFANDNLSVDKSLIYGVYSGRNRWLGVLILFAKSIAGRLLFLIVPTLLLIFYKPLKRFVLKYSKIFDKER